MRLRDLESVAKLAVVTGEKRGQRERDSLSVERARGGGMPLVNKEISPGWLKLKVHKCWGGGGGGG